MRRFALQLAALSLASLVVGCTDAGLESSAATEGEAIVNGHVSTPVDDAVVVIGAGDSSCTGTLIAPTVVLTALHCVTNFDSRFLFNCRPDGTLAPGSTTGIMGPVIDPRAVVIATGVDRTGESIRAKQIYSTGSTDACHDDLAVIVLESPAAIGDAPLVAMRFDRPTVKGEMTRIVGYGSVESTDTERGRQERTGIKLFGVGGPDGATPGDAGVLPRTAMIKEGPCHGDSGGPLFSEETGAEIGVYSILHSTTCTGTDVRNSYTLIAPYEPLIRMALESEGAEPILEAYDPPTGAGGEAGATGEGGEPGTAGVGNEAGAAAEPATGGSVGVGGSTGGSSQGARGGTGGSSGSTGEGAAPPDPDEGSGSGSRRDPSCACRTAGTHEPAPWAIVSSMLGLAAWSVARRRRTAQRRALRAH